MVEYFTLAVFLYIFKGIKIWHQVCPKSGGIFCSNCIASKSGTRYVQKVLEYFALAVFFTFLRASNSGTKYVQKVVEYFALAV